MIKPTEINISMHLYMSIANNRYNVVNIKKIISLTNILGVILILLSIGAFGIPWFIFDARVVRNITTVQIKKVPPISILTA